MPTCGGLGAAPSIMKKVGDGEDVVLGGQQHFGRKEDGLANGSCSLIRMW